ncbi:MAG TPA: hypothetical protein DCM27_01905 [Rhodospirillaceae bacterium]|nr:hypothetical protein [Rhodospirillaceae bacterium]
MTGIFPVNPPFDNFMLPVSGGHSLYVAQFGNLDDALSSIQIIEENPRDEIPITRIFMHYCLHEFDDLNKRKILTSKNLSQIPMDIVHGRHDRICPVQSKGV